MKQDQLTLDRINQIHPHLKEELYDIYNEICTELNGRAMCRFAYVLRSFKEQQDLYDQGRNGKAGKVVTNAKAGESYHNYGLAVDIVLLLDKDGNGSFETASWDTSSDYDGDGQADWQEVVRIFKSHGWIAGIDWKFRDAPHFEKSLGYSVKTLLAKYNKAEFMHGTNYLRL